MNRTLKKVVSILLVTIIIFGAAPLASFVGIELPELNLFVSKAEAATHSGKCGSTAWWEYDSITRVLTITGTGEISSYSWDNDKQSYNRPWEQYVSNIKQIVIDEGITTIGMEAFANHKNVQTIQLPDSLEELFFRAFYDCSSLKSITIPNNVISIGASSFGNCSSLNSVILPNSLTSLYGGAFHNCTSLESVTLSNSLTTLESNTFGGCSKLESVVIPNSVTTLKENVFSFCINLKEITLSNNISQISDGAFDNCLNLSDIYYDGTYSDFSKISIGANNKQLAYVTIHCSDSVSIGIFGSCGDEIYWSFHGESGVFSVSGNGYMNAYYPYTERPWDSYRDDVKHIIINEGITDIGWNTFCYFYDLETIVIPVSVKQIDEKALYYLNSLTDIYYCGTETQWNEIIIDENNDTFENVRIHYSTPTGKCGDNLNWIFDEVSKTLTVLGNGSMYDYNYNNRPWEILEDEIKTIVICNGATSIGKFAFAYCAEVTNVIIGESVITINEYAFRWCHNLTSITIPEGLTSIGIAAFEDCSSLTSISIPDAVSTIGGSAFYKCSSLKNISIPDSVTEIDFDTFAGCTSLTSIIIPKNVTSIGERAFENCYNLTNVTIPNSVTQIEDHAFKGCILLASILIPDSVTSIGEEAFYNTAYYNDSSNWEDSVLYIDKYLIRAETNISGSYSIKFGTTVIADYAFSECDGLKRITIPNSVKYMGIDTFIESTSLVDVYYTGELAGWCTIDFPLYHSSPMCYADNLYINGILVADELIIPDSVTSIGDYAFVNCSSLSRITIPRTVEKIGCYAFLYCNSLENVEIPNSVTSIGSGAFDSCTSLKSVAIPDSITSIPSHAFDDCKKLISITISNGITSIGDCAFRNCYSLTSVTIPDSVTNIESYAFYCCDSLKDVYYIGSEEEWTEINIGSYNSDLTNATIHYNHIHNYTETIVTPAKCLTDGKGFGTCICGLKTDTYIISATGHNYESIVTNPTCTEDGYTTHICLVCGDAYVDGEVGAIGHDIIIDEAVEATCTATGLTEGQHCSRCDDATVEQETMPKVKHEMVVDVAVSPTCTQTGLTAGCHCKNCDEATIEQEVVPILGHTESDTVTENSIEAKCGQEGSYDSVVYCSNCGEEISRETITVDTLEHQYDEVVTAPACTEGGYTTYTCSLCGDTYIDNEVSALGHNIIIDEEVAATCTETGLTEGQHCSRCDNVTVVQKTIPLKPHNHTVKYDSGKHWKECVCGSKIEMQNHTFDGNSLCECGYKRVVNATVIIKNNTGSRTINYGETLKLSVIATDKPADATITWYVDGVKMSEGETFNVSFESGTKTVEVKLVDANGSVLKNASGNEIKDSENVTVKGGFFQKIISFFKNLFGINRTVVQAIFKGTF